MSTTNSKLRKWLEQLFPIHRSQTGRGVRETLQLIQSFGVDLVQHEIPSGTKCFDWEVPLEWNIRDAYIANLEGDRIVDYRNSNLHVSNGSHPIQQVMSFKELEPNLAVGHCESAIPYRTAFSREAWGFSVTPAQWNELRQCEQVVVFIDSEFKPGALSYGEALLTGESDESILIWTHTCHPSLANDNVSGMVASAELYLRLSQVSKRRFNYRFVFAPATIGAITWLSENQKDIPDIHLALVLSLLGGPAEFTLKSTRQGDHDVDRAFENIVNSECHPAKIRKFEPVGYDERQFSSPGIGIPTARITREVEGEFPEYHTSLDNLDFVDAAQIEGAVELLQDLLNMLEANCTPINRFPYCEPQLGRRGIAFGINDDAGREWRESISWVLNLSDGNHDALAISDKSQIPFPVILKTIHYLRDKHLVAIQGERNGDCLL